MNRKYYVFAGAFIGLCLMLCWGVWFSMSKLREYREEFDRLNSERQSNSGTITSIEAQNKELSNLAALGINDTVLASDAVAFFAMIEPIMDARNINRVYTATSGQDSSGKRDNIIQLRINCKYYDMANMLADMRNLKAPSRITHLNIRRNQNLPEELIEADMTIEVLTEERL